MFQEKNYLNNWIQSLFNSLPPTLRVRTPPTGIALYCRVPRCILALKYAPQGSTLVIGGDGRYWNKEALQIIIKMCAGNGVAKVVSP